MEMSRFRTMLKPLKIDLHICHKDRIVLVGSCFAQNIGERLKQSKFTTCINPFGIIYNPVAIAQNVERIFLGDDYTETDIVFHREMYHSFDFHGSFSSPDRKELLERMNEAKKSLANELALANVLIVTLGSAWVYALKETNRVVANCHKVSAKTFDKYLLDTDECYQVLSDMLKRIKKINEQIKVVFTVSPVRHIKDGFHENNLSKSTLLLAINRLVGEDDACSYFPAYELVMDDLRDYRFFEEDLVHPNKQAVDYIWNYFGDIFFDSKTKSLQKSIDKLNRAVQHRPFHPELEQHQQFVQKALKEITQLKDNNPYLNFNREEQILRDQLK